MKEKVNVKFLKIALELMNEHQLKHFALELEDRMEQLKTKLIENNNEEFSVDIREEYVVLKDIHCIIIT